MEDDYISDIDYIRQKLLKAVKERNLKAIKKYSLQLELLEGAELIRRTNMARYPIRRIFKINTTSISRNETEKYIKKLHRKFKKRKYNE